MSTVIDLAKKPIDWKEHWVYGPDHQVKIGWLEVRWHVDRPKGYNESLGGLKFAWDGTLGKERLHFTIWWRGRLILERQPGLLLPRFPALPWANKLIDWIHWRVYWPMRIGYGQVKIALYTVYYAVKG